MCDPIFSNLTIVTFTTLLSRIQFIMNVVSPLEAEAFNYLSFGFLTLLSNFWTWLALTFWRTRTPTSELLPPPDESELDPVAVTARVPTPFAVGNGAVDVDGARKGKFTLYYEDELERECETTVTEERDGRGWEWWESWETLLKMKRGENQNGWYTGQDLTALNGSVVRLWGGTYLHHTTQ